LKPVLQTAQLSKQFGKIKAVNNLNLDIREGNVFGILGPNGSGKTTTLGMVLNVIKPTRGHFYWFDQKPTNQSRKKIGAILETPAFYPYLSPVRNLNIIARIKGKGAERIEEVLKQVNLYERRKDPFRTFSLGMKQRLAVAASLIADPPVLILDEPTNGLDPQGIAEIRELIIKIADQGKTIILASHILDEVQKVCTHFAVLNRGESIYQGSVAEALEGNNTLEVASENMVALELSLNEMRNITDLRKEQGKYIVTFKDATDPTTINRYLFDRGITVSHLSLKKTSLEKQFLEILKTSNGTAVSN